MSFVFVPVYVDRLGVEAYGLVGFYAVLLAWMSLLDMGLSPTLNREMARARAGTHTPESLSDLLRSVEVAALTISATAALMVWAVADWLADRWFEPVGLDRRTVADAIGIMAFIVTARAGESLYRGALFGMERQVWYNTTVAILATLRAGGAAVVVTQVPTIGAFFGWQAVVSALTVLVLALATRRFLPRPVRAARVSMTSLRRVRGFAGGMSLTVLSGLLVSHLDKLLLARFLDLEGYGRYMLAVTVAGVLAMGVGPVAAAFAPRIIGAVARQDEGSAAVNFRLAAQIGAVTVMPASALLVLMPETLLFAWTGDQDVATLVAPLLAPLAIAAVTNAILTIPYVLQIAHGDTRLSVLVNLCALCVLAPTVILGSMIGAGRGAAIAAAGTGLVIFFLSSAFIFRRSLPGERSAWLMRAVLVPGIVAYAAVGAMRLILTPEGRMGAVLAIASAAALSAGAVIIASPEITRRLRQMYDNRL